MGARLPEEAMKTVYSTGSVKVPDDCKVTVKSRLVMVTGPRGSLTKSFKHMSVDLSLLADGKTIKVEKWFGKSKELAIIKTVCSHIQNLFIGVTKGFEYRMKMVYAHLPTNVQIAPSKQELEGVTMERNPGNNAEIIISGTDIENVSSTCALISQSCAVKNKDIRKFLDGIYVSQKGHITKD